VKASIIVPILYVEPRLRETVARLADLRERLDLEILLVVDVPDRAREEEARAENDPIGSEAGAKVLYRLGERGFGSALRHGFAGATGDAVIPFMGDACDDPADIPALLGKIEAGWDVVAGSRYMRGGRIVGNTTKQRLSRAYSVLSRWVGGPKIHDVTNAFKAYRGTVVDTVATVAESYDISVELTVKAYQAGFRVTEVPTTWTNRDLGESNWRFSNEFRRYARWLWLAARGRRGVRRRAGAGRTEPAERP
jgi:glycosyltransferase involved in cell wall biosynthesis